MKITGHLGGKVGMALLAAWALLVTAGATDVVETMYLTATVERNEPLHLTVIPEGDGEDVEIFDIVAQPPEEDDQEESKDEIQAPEVTDKEESDTEEPVKEETDADEPIQEESVTEEPAEKESKEPNVEIPAPTEKVETNTTSNEYTEAE